MASYEKVFSKFLARITDRKLMSLDDNSRLELQTEWLHMALDNVEIRQLFSSIVMNDEVQSFTFELNNPVDDETDESFVTDVLAMGMSIAWMTPKVNDSMYMSMYIGGKEEKKLYDGHAYTPNLLDTLEKKMHKRIAKHEYHFGDIGGAQ